jgi:hypothetical protein
MHLAGFEPATFLKEWRIIRVDLIETSLLKPYMKLSFHTAYLLSFNVLFAMNTIVYQMFYLAS